MKTQGQKKIIMLSKQTKIIASIILAVICLLCFAIISFYFGSHDDYESNLPNNAASDEKLEIFRSKNGFYGVADNDGNEIISPSWNSIAVLPDGNFIVSCIMNNEEAFGIIDNEENVITAFAYSEIRSIDTNIIVGKVCDTGHYILIRSDGSLYTDDEWDSYDISGNDIVLSKKRSKYQAVINGGKIIFKSFDIKQSIGKFPVSFKSDASDFSGFLSSKAFEKTAEAVSKYTSALADGDRNTLQTLTSSEYYESIVPVEIIGRTISNASDAVIYPIQNTDGSVVYSTEFTLEYSFAEDNSPENNNDEISVNSQSESDEQSQSNKFRFTIETEKTNNGSVIITSVKYNAE